MNILYAKSILYAYSNLQALMEQIDELVEKKALASMYDFSSAELQCEKILSYTRQKDVLIDLKLIVDKILLKFTKDELDCLDYKYFKTKPKDYFNNVDTQSRAYFRRQIKLAKKFSEKLEIKGVNDKWFKENCLSTDFFKELLKRVVEHETLFRKNKPLKEKNLLKKAGKFNNNDRKKTIA